MTDHSTFDDAELASTLRITLMRLSRRVRSERSDESLGLSQLSALSTINHFGPLSAKKLAELERVRPAALTRILAELEKRNLVTRETHPDDRRQAILSLSADGRAILRSDSQRRTAWLTRTLSKLNTDERSLLIAALPLLEFISES